MMKTLFKINTFMTLISVEFCILLKYKNSMIIRDIKNCSKKKVFIIG